MADGLAYSLYNPTQTELTGVVDSYNKLGGLQGTGMDFKTWTGTQGISTSAADQNNGMFDWLGSDSMKGISTIGGLGLGAFNIWNSMNAQEQAKKQWEAENARADKILGMNTERYEQWKADKNRLNSQYA